MPMKRLFTFFLKVLAGLILQQSALAVGNVRLMTDDPSALIRHPKQLPRLARVRLSMVLTNYKKFLVRNNYAKVREMFRPIKPIKHHLRARIEKTNHFYIDDLHIETVPISWSKERMQLKMKLRFYRRYGNENKLEEAIGSTIITGSLEGGDHLYSFIGTKKIKFKNLLGHPILDIAIGAPKRQPGALSDSGPPIPPPKKKL